MAHLSLLLAWPALAFAQVPSFEPPVVNRPVDFSNVVGKYTIKAEAEPLQVHIEEPILLQILITGEGPKEYEPSRKHLRLFPDAWNDDFYVQPLPDRDKVMRDKKTWLFVYRLKPKHGNVKAIDDIVLSYYDPVRKDFFKPYADTIEITVKPRPPIVDLELDLKAAPDSFYETLDSEMVQESSERFIPRVGVNFILLLAIWPVICLIGVILWRRAFPEEARRTMQHRNRAAQRTLALLESGNDSSWEIVRRYLHERLDFCVEDPAPAEVAAFLKRQGFAKPAFEQGRAFFQACDAVRFMPSATTNAAPLAVDAKRLIHALEGDPCQRA